MKEYRQEQILQYLAMHGSLQINDFAAQLHVSQMTLRRDLDELAGKSLLLRTHGGALQAPHKVDTPFSFRIAAQQQEKQIIARAATQTVPDGIRLFLASGTTLYSFAKELSARHSLTIVTNSIQVGYELVNNSDNIVVITGGELKRSTLAATGPVAENAIEAFLFDAVYLGMTAVSDDGQLFLGSIAELGIFQHLLTTPNHVYILADSSKLGRSDFIKAGVIQAGYTLITDAAADPVHLHALRRLGCRIIVAE